MSTVPQPPQPYYAHPYPLQQRFTGRVNERQLLSEWFTFGDQAVLALSAPSGMGKSALAWAWLQRDVLGVPLAESVEDPPVVAQACRVSVDRRPAGVLWWSFEQPPARFAPFLDAALQYISAGQSEPGKLPSTHDKTSALLELLEQNRVLIVLDAFERELRGYARVSTSYRGDTTLAENARVDFRTCSDPRVGDFLRRLTARDLVGRVLLLSRVLPREIDGERAVRRERLAGLDADNAVAFFEGRKIRGTRAEINTACKAYGFHPLSVRLLAGLIVNDPGSPGDARLAAKHLPPSQRARTKYRILGAAYDALPPATQGLISRMAAVRVPIQHDALRSVFGDTCAVAGVVNQLKRVVARAAGRSAPRDLTGCLAALAKHDFLLVNEENTAYDLHPLVRRYAYRRLSDKRRVHAQLREHYAALAESRAGDLAALTEAYHHAVRAGDYAQALSICRDKLLKVLPSNGGTYVRCTELLRALFPNGDDGLPALEDPRDQYWALNALANSLALCGQPLRAVRVFEQAAKVAERRGVRRDHAVSLGNMAHQQMLLGDLTAAELNLRSAVELCHGLGAFEEALGHRELGRLLLYRGDFSACDEVHRRALQLAARCGNLQVECVVHTHSALRALFTKDHGTALAEARRARDLAQQDFPGRRKVERDIICAERLLAAALLAVAEQIPSPESALAEAATHLRAALARCRRSDLYELEPSILLTCARWYHARKQDTQALAEAEAALALADRCDYRLKQADAHNLLARLALHSRDRTLAQRHAQKARERAWCDGPPNCYKPALDEATHTAARIGAQPVTT